MSLAGAEQIQRLRPTYSRWSASKIENRQAFVMHGETGYFTMLTRPLGPYPQEGRANRVQHCLETYTDYTDTTINALMPHRLAAMHPST